MLLPGGILWLAIQHYIGTPLFTKAVPAKGCANWYLKGIDPAVFPLRLEPRFDHLAAFQRANTGKSWFPETALQMLPRPLPALPGKALRPIVPAWNQLIDWYYVGYIMGSYFS
ncbi:hypothetical protein CJU94_03765 [Paraburkholderia aromaticivorans]|uniref:Uncharacterized protein n=2 Tax=Paraburkholderia aromaticivorans TaxID=2026199 RepID=A0A248VG43_9BURK|nr:hypothetical protein CJU94_03765 [Paraburkholderia aromaticivorans]